MSGERVLTRRELNRALLARQLLLERRTFSAVKAVERLGGLQAQATPSPYLSLWTRLEGLEREELTEALTRRRLVKALLQRGTLHIVTPARLLGVLDRAPRARRHPLAARLRGARPEGPAGEAGATCPRGARGGQRTFKEMRALLEPHARGAATPTFLWRRVQGHASVVHVPPSGIWGYGGHGVYAAAAGRVRGEPPPARRPSTTSSAGT